MMLVFERIHPDAILPTKGSMRAACYDLYSVDEGHVAFGQVSIFATGIKMAIPAGYMGHIVPRSGLAAKLGVQVMAGIIDSDYRGEIKVVLTTAKREGGWHGIKVGDRIAQLLVVPNPSIMTCEGKVNETKRGVGGFGSTGS